MHGRDPGRIADTPAEIGGGAGRSYQADLADLAPVRDLADQVLATEPRLDVPVNNAGIGSDVPGRGARQESADGDELPVLQRAAPGPTRRRPTPRPGANYATSPSVWTGVTAR